MPVFTKPLYGILQILNGNRFGKVVERADANSIHRIVVVRCGENDIEVKFTQFLQHTEAIHTGHLYIEEENIGLVLPY